MLVLPSTQWNKEGFNLFCSVQSDRIFLDQKQRKQKIWVLEQILMLVWTKEGRGNYPCVHLESVEVLRGEINGSLFFGGLGKISLYLCAHHTILFVVVY